MTPTSSDKMLAAIWQAYTDKQCGWQDSTSYHGHTMCDRSGMEAAAHEFSLLLMDGMPDTVPTPTLPSHFESFDERRSEQEEATDD